jgi:hypothetical protein
VLAEQPMGAQTNLHTLQETVQAEQFLSNLAFHSGSGSIIILIPILSTLSSLESACLSSSYDSLGLDDF